MAKGDSIITVIGARKRTQLDDSSAAVAIRLAPEEMVRIEEAIPASQVADTRYAEPRMSTLHSER